MSTDYFLVLVAALAVLVAVVVASLRSGMRASIWSRFLNPYTGGLLLMMSAGSWPFNLLSDFKVERAERSR